MDDVTHWILLTASREWTDRARMCAAFVAIQRKLAVPPERIGLTHGAARGGDRMGAEIATELGWVVDPVPCTPEEWDQYGRAAGHRRNARMVARHDYVGCVAFRRGESRGTNGCARMASSAGIPVWNIGE